MKAVLSLLLCASFVATPGLGEVAFSGAPQPAAPEAPAPQAAPDPEAPPPKVDPVAAIGPLLVVNGAAISGYEVTQRMAFLKALQQQGDLRQQAMDALITERAEGVEAARLGLSVTPDQLRGGMTEFAARANLSVEAFVAALGAEGVAPETFRDFVKSGLLWRAAVREKFAGKVEVTDAEVDRAIGMGASGGAERRVLLSELVIAADGARDPSALAGRVRLAIKTKADFARLARQFSKAATASNGGELGWLAESKLPADVAGAVRALHPGEMTGVLAIPGGAAIYYLRDEGAAEVKGGPQVVDYAVLAKGTGTMAAKVTGCDRLYALGPVTRDTLPEASLPGTLAAAVAGLDAGEAAALPDGRLVMVCARRPASTLPAAREAVRGDILNRKVSLLADAWAEELRFNAYVETP